MDLQLKNKKALVTGSTAGIGYSIALQLAKEGAEVFVNGRTDQRVDKAVAQIKTESGNDKVSGVVADFTSQESINKLISELPQIDILVNNVAIFEPKAFADITDADWLRFYEINVLSGIRMARAYFGKMLENGWGRIIFISSESAIQIPEEMIHYGMTKTAQLAVARGLAELTRGTQVTVNSVLPGPTLSEGVGGFIENLAKDQSKTTDEVEADFFKTVRPTSIIQRFLSTDEVANIVTYLASPLASGTNGAAVRVEGGLLKGMV
ncbi:SDR family NAD(P)-dependent oxidoreductase [Mucilaginibacter auburnensis]|uniref:NAD(P)-dependent dehydrogenase (Short-subunit alcohol dehydrogenase family) n=1 Tax=Mucilaginibacter auburnensis TaxID=1457233 RepID=A0A2H9VW73_9SPHI|nr:SDR family oxidoreductase [Mucilaginibacter auburnensis]PJJ85039.1 NAD(P)-dependent dehydrogenase (short-subunit alcohol dehydrogenase family) [Mucilaginibacter auburnensis]